METQSVPPQNPDAPTAGVGRGARLVSSSRIEGATVYDRAGHKVGNVHTFMIDQISGRVAYAVLSFGGFLGLGQKYHPVPWEAISYDVEREGYVVSVEKSLLDGSPSFRPDDAPNFDDAYGERISAYYGLGRSTSGY